MWRLKLFEKILHKNKRAINKRQNWLHSFVVVHACVRGWGRLLRVLLSNMQTMEKEKKQQRNTKWAESADDKRVSRLVIINDDLLVINCVCWWIKDFLLYWHFQSVVFLLEDNRHFCNKCSSARHRSARSASCTCKLSRLLTWTPSQC